MAGKNNNEVTGWAGWIYFASFMLLLAGAFHIIEGLVALFRNTVFVATANNVWALNYHEWGWLHIIGGILLLIGAGSLASGNVYGRILAVFLAFVSALLNMAFLPIYPLWSILIIVIDIFVIYAVVVHGKEVRPQDE